MTIRNENSKKVPSQRGSAKGESVSEKQDAAAIHASFLDVSGDERHNTKPTDREVSVNKSSHVGHSGQTSTTEDSDNDFQSAYSVSPHNEPAILDSAEEQVRTVAVSKGESLEDRLSAPPRTRKEKNSGHGHSR